MKKLMVVFLTVVFVFSFSVPVVCAAGGPKGNNGKHFGKLLRDHGEAKTRAERKVLFEAMNAMDENPEFANPADFDPADFDEPEPMKKRGQRGENKKGKSQRNKK